MDVTPKPIERWPEQMQAREGGEGGERRGGEEREGPRTHLLLTLQKKKKEKKEHKCAAFHGHLHCRPFPFQQASSNPCAQARSVVLQWLS